MRIPQVIAISLLDIGDVNRPFTYQHRRTDVYRAGLANRCNSGNHTGMEQSQRYAVHFRTAREADLVRNVLLDGYARGWPMPRQCRWAIQITRWDCGWDESDTDLATRDRRSESVVRPIRMTNRRAIRKSLPNPIQCRAYIRRGHM
jgi:hypothetical protein